MYQMLNMNYDQGINLDSFWKKHCSWLWIENLLHGRYMGFIPIRWKPWIKNDSGGVLLGVQLLLIGQLHDKCEGVGCLILCPWCGIPV